MAANLKNVLSETISVTDLFKFDDMQELIRIRFEDHTIVCFEKDGKINACFFEVSASKENRLSLP